MLDTVVSELWQSPYNHQEEISEDTATTLKIVKQKNRKNLDLFSSLVIAKPNYNKSCGILRLFKRIHSWHLNECFLLFAANITQYYISC